MPDDLVLIGPIRAGKSTLGRLLAARLGRPQVSLDALRGQYSREIGFDPQLAAQIRKQAGFLALVYYRYLFDAHAVERMLAEHHGCVFDFGADIFESDEAFARVQRALAGYPNVILLLPSPDVDESRRILMERDTDPPADLHFDLLGYYLRHHSYYDLAKFTVYTAGKTPGETCEEILGLANLQGTV